MLVDVEDGKVVKVRPNPEHKISHGGMCTNPTSAIELSLPP